MNGVVMKSTGSWYKVRLEDGNIVDARLKGKFRTKGLRVTNPVSVGDVVVLEAEDEQCLIVKIHDRKNYIIRKSVNLSKQYHILASNLDQAVLIVTIAKPYTSLEFIDRFLVTAEAYDVPTTIVVNKLDLYNEEEQGKLADLMQTYDEAGYKVLLVSAEKGINIEEFKVLLKDKVSLIGGHSGVGKSTLLNTVDSNWELKTSEISEAHDQGIHTTTFAEMFEISEGGFVIDTPGIRGLGVVDIEKEELANFFPEMLSLKGNCKFSNCVHINEPGCAVKQGVEEGVVAMSRYSSYLSIYGNDENENYR